MPVSSWSSFLALLGEMGHLLEDTRRDMVAARLACTLAALQVGVFSNHVLPELVLPPGQLLFVTNDLFGAESAIWRQGDKRKVLWLFSHPYAPRRR